MLCFTTSLRFLLQSTNSKHCPDRPPDELAARHHYKIFKHLTPYTADKQYTSLLSVVRDFETGGGLNQERVLAHHG